MTAPPLPKGLPNGTVYQGCYSFLAGDRMILEADHRCVLYVYKQSIGPLASADQDGTKVVVV